LESEDRFGRRIAEHVRGVCADAVIFPCCLVSVRA
jgi:hypothetical protein